VRSVRCTQISAALELLLVTRTVAHRGSIRQGRTFATRANRHQANRRFEASSFLVKTLLQKAAFELAVQLFRLLWRPSPSEATFPRPCCAAPSLEPSPLSAFGGCLLLIASLRQNVGTLRSLAATGVQVALGVASRHFTQHRSRLVLEAGVKAQSPTYC